MRFVELVSRLIAQIPRRARVPLVLLLAFFLSLATLSARDARSGDAFDFVRWERATVANKWLYAFGGPFRDDMDADEAIVRYFALDDYSTDEARELENIVEAEIEGRVDKVIAELGIDGRLPLPGSVFPPVDIELASSPRALVVSPRDYIERTSTDLLRPDLTLDDAVTLEQSVEENDMLSALVVSTGGVAAYPAVVKEGRSYAGTVSTAAHEWVHHYLTFYELGLRYNSSTDLRTINETLADIAGDEIAAIVIERFGDATKSSEPPAASLATSPTEPAAPAVDRNEVLRELRFEVDELLADGEIEVAEARMEAVRLELCELGFCPRRINQAYFAWYGTYAARDDAVDPLGEQLRALREQFGSLEAFLTAIRGVGSRAEVEALLKG